MGAGPYGLSLAAHLQARRAPFHIVGHPLTTWRDHMPAGMHLKSDGFASSLSDPQAGHTLGDYCRGRGLPYDDNQIPVPLARFVDYGLDFQSRRVPSLDRRLITMVETSVDGFTVAFDDGGHLNARRVVLAVGISPFRHWPDALGGLPGTCVSHSFDHGDIGHLRDRDVMVIGAGASAVDLTAALHDVGARPQMAIRGARVRFGSQPTGQPPGFWRRLRHPPSGLGPGLRSALFERAPHLFRHLPAETRQWIVRRHLGPASPWSMKERVVGRTPIHLDHALRAARAHQGKVHLTFETPGGGTAVFAVDHVIAATGYRTDIDRLDFVSASLRRRIHTIAQAPVLSANFETSVKGLYVIGPAAAASFGPLMRFMVGAGFAARTVSRQLARGRP